MTVYITSGEGSSERKVNDMAFIKCTKCQEMFNTEKAAEQHQCIPGIASLGTSQMKRFRGSSIGRQIDGNVKLAYLRAKQDGEEEIAKLRAKNKELRKKIKALKGK